MKNMWNGMNKTFAMIMTLVLAVVSITGVVAFAEKDGTGEALAQPFADAAADCADAIEDEIAEEVIEEEPAEEEVIEEVIEEEPAEEEVIEEVIEEEPAEEEVIEEVVEEEPAEEETAEEVAEEKQTKVGKVAVDVSKLRVEIESSLQDVAVEGETITLTSKLIGFEGLAYKLQWQRNDGSGWKNVEGATGESYSYIADAENVSYQWRLLVSL